MNLFAWLDELVQKEGFRFLVVGGHAVNAYGYARYTKDLDLLINRDEKERWLCKLYEAGFTLVHDGGNFLQLTSSASGGPVDFMLVNEQTFQRMEGEAGATKICDFNFRVPSLNHLLALKIHALKYGPPVRGLKDFSDVLHLIEVNRIEPLGDNFRALCDKYGDKTIYERIVKFSRG